MAHTKVTKAYSANTGVANTYSYSGSFDVFKGTEVVVTLDGVALTFTSSTINESASPREYTVDVTAKTIHIGGGDLSSGTIVIRPETDMGAPTPRATYTPGASITSEDLNNNQTQLMRKAMEYDETKMSTTGSSVMTGHLQMGEDTTIIFEGATDDGYETTLTVTDPTADRTITLPNVTGTVVTTGDSQSVATGMIANDAINGTKIADDAIDSEHYTNASIDADHLASSSVTNAKIAGDAVTGAKIADDAIDSEHYTDGSIDTAHIADANVTLAKIEDVTDGRIIVGNGSNRPTAVAVSGDVTLANTGAVTIAGNAVEIGMIGCEQTTISDSDSHIPTSGAVVDYVAAAIAPLGGFEAIATEDVFPTTIPAAGVIVSIADATEISVNSSGVATNCRTDGNGSDNVTINGFPSVLRGGVGSNADPYILPASSGLLVVSTGSSHTYTYHRLIATTEDIKLLSDTVESFKARYRVASSAPGSANDDGDLYYNTSNDTLYVYDGSQWEASVSSTPNDDSVTAAKIDLSIVAGDIIYGSGTDTWQRLAKPSSNKFLRNTSGGTLSWETVDTTTITVADESSDTSCYVAYFTDATGDLAPKTGTNLTFNSNTGALAATSFSGDGSALTGIAAAQGGSTDKIFWENGQTVTADYTITNNYNAGTFGPVTINNGVTVTVGSGETWTIV